MADRETWNDEKLLRKKLKNRYGREFCAANEWEDDVWPSIPPIVLGPVAAETLVTHLIDVPEQIDRATLQLFPITSHDTCFTTRQRPQGIEVTFTAPAGSQEGLYRMDLIIAVGAIARTVSVSATVG